MWCRRAHLRSDAAQRYIRAHRTRSKCRRRFTAPHHHTRTPRLRFPHSQFQIQTRRNEARTLSADTRLYSALLFEGRCTFLFQKRKSDKQSAVVEIVLSLLLFVEFEIISGSADWKRAENSGIQMAGCAFRRTAEEILGDFGAEFSKTKTLGAGVRIFNGAVRAEREFPLKILFLACIQVFSVLLYSAERRSKSPQPLSEYDFCLLCIKVFSDFFQSHAAINSKFPLYLRPFQQYSHIISAQRMYFFK